MIDSYKLSSFVFHFIIQAMGRLGFPPETTIKQAFAAMSKNSTFILENGVS